MNMKTVPESLITHSSFPLLFDGLLDRLGAYGRDGEKPSLDPWKVLTKPDRFNEDLITPEADKNPDYALYVSILRTLTTCLTETIPTHQDRWKALHQKQSRIYSRHKRETPSYKAIWAEIHTLNLGVDWLDTEYQSDRWRGFKLGVIREEEGYWPSNHATISVLAWTLMKLGVFDLNHFILYSETCGGILDLEDLNAWEPLFSLHKISNETLCNGVLYGQYILGEERWKHRALVNESVHDEEGPNFKCFLDGDLTHCLTGWMRQFQHWGYTRESAIEFFGLNGFFTHLYNDVYVGLSDATFPTWIHKVVLPEFNNYFPKPEKKKRVKKK